MKLLLDTHIWLWWTLEPKKLPKKAYDLISDKKLTIVVSAASVWEIAIKYGLKKLSLPMPPPVYVASRLAAQRFAVLPITAEHAAGVAELPEHHKDPFDRLLIVQAQIEGMRLLTADRAFQPYVVNAVIVPEKGKRP